jgi:hypothetical protein
MTMDASVHFARTLERTAPYEVATVKVQADRAADSPLF